MHGADEFCSSDVSYTYMQEATHKNSKPVIFYLSFMLVVYKTDSLTHSRKPKIIWFFLAQICTKLFSGWGFAPDPTGGAQSGPQTLAGKGRGKEGKGIGRGGKGSEGSLPPLKFKSGYTPLVCV